MNKMNRHSFVVSLSFLSGLHCVMLMSETNRWFINMIIYLFYFSVIPLSECWDCTADASTSQISEAKLPLSLWPDL